MISLALPAFMWLEVRAKGGMRHCTPEGSSTGMLHVDQNQPSADQKLGDAHMWRTISDSKHSHVCQRLLHLMEPPTAVDCV